MWIYFFFIELNHFWWAEDFLYVCSVMSFNSHRGQLEDSSFMSSLQHVLSLSAPVLSSSFSPQCQTVRHLQSHGKDQLCLLLGVDIITLHLPVINGPQRICLKKTSRDYFSIRVLKEIRATCVLVGTNTVIKPDHTVQAKSLGNRLLSQVHQIIRDPEP